MSQSYKKKFYQLSKKWFQQNIAKAQNQLTWLGHIVEKVDEPTLMMVYLVVNQWTESKSQTFFNLRKTSVDSQMVLDHRKTFEDVAQIITSKRETNLFEEIKTKNPKSDIDFIVACYEVLFGENPRLSGATLGDNYYKIQDIIDGLSDEDEDLIDGDDMGEEDLHKEETDGTPAQQQQSTESPKVRISMERGKTPKKPDTRQKKDIPSGSKRKRSIEMYPGKEYVFRGVMSQKHVTSDDLSNLFMEYIKVFSDKNFQHVLTREEPTGWLMVDSDGDPVSDETIGSDRIFRYLTQRDIITRVSKTPV